MGIQVQVCDRTTGRKRNSTMRGERGRFFLPFEPSAAWVIVVRSRFGPAPLASDLQTVVFQIFRSTVRSTTHTRFASAVSLAP
jgi:hypothetical protein